MQFVSSIFGERALIVLGVLFALILLGVFGMTVTRALSDRAGRAFGSRSRQQRLGVVDAFDLDRQRQLVIIRRDNVEHLVMIGGPNDVVIEAAIVQRATAAQREAFAPASAGPARHAAAATEPRPDFETPAPEPALPFSAAHGPAEGPAPTQVPGSSSGSGQRAPFPPQRVAPLPGAPQRTAARDPLRAIPQPAPPVVASKSPAPPPPAPPPPEAEEIALGGQAQPAAAPGVQPPTRLQQRVNPLPRPSRPFPSLRPGGGNLFPVRSSASAPAGKPPEPAAPPPAQTAERKPDPMQSFESLEEEMAKLLGRPGSGES